MILLTTFASLRFGEVTALERRDIDLDAGAVEVRRAFVEVRGKGLVAGNTLAARSGVSTRDLMSRMGHDSVRAAIIYQHATTEADARIADSLDADIAGAVTGGGPETDENGGGVVPPFG